MIQPGFPSFLPITFAIGGLSFGNLVGQRTRLDHGPRRTGLPIIGDNEVEFRKTWTFMLSPILKKDAAFSDVEEPLIICGPDSGVLIAIIAASPCLFRSLGAKYRRWFFCLFHFSSEWIAAVVLSRLGPPGTSLLCVVIRLWRACTYL